MKRAVAVLLLLLPGLAFAVNGVVSCSVSNFTYNFNAYDPIGGADDTLPTGNVTVSCTSTSNQTIAVTVNLTLTVGTRSLAGPGGDSLSYDLYTNSAAPQTQWNTTNKLTCTFNVTNPSTSTTCPFYGKITGGQNVRAGSYSQGVSVGGTWSCSPNPTTC